MLTLMVDLDAADAHPDLNRVVELAQVFKANQQPFTLMTAKAAPDLQFMLHQVGLDTVPLVRLYDQLLGIPEPIGTPLQLAEVPLPADLLPVYAWPNVNYFDGERLAKTVSLHPLGFVWQITDYEPTGTRRVAQYDDRGNRLYVDYREQGNGLVKREWFDAQDQLVMTEDRQGAVTMAPQVASRFAFSHYPDRSAVLAEVMDRWVMAASRQPTLVATMTPANLALRRQLTLFPQVIFLAAANTELKVVDRLGAQAADQVVLPTQEDRRLFLQQFQNAADWQDQTQAILPYPTTLSLGHSNEVPTMMTYWFVGDADEAEFRQTLEQMLTMLQKNRAKTVMIEADDDARVEAGQRVVAHWLETKLGVDLQSEDYQNVMAYLKKKQANELTPAERKAGKSLRESAGWGTASAAYNLQQRVVLNPPLPPEDQEAAMSAARVYLDTSKLTNLRLQMLAISNAIPQLVRRANDFIEDHQTGIVVATPDQIVPGLSYFLDTLHHWNTAQVGNAALLEANTATHIMNEWKKVI